MEAELRAFAKRSGFNHPQVAAFITAFSARQKEKKEANTGLSSPPSLSPSSSTPPSPPPAPAPAPVEKLSLTEACDKFEGDDEGLLTCIATQVSLLVTNLSSRRHVGGNSPSSSSDGSSSPVSEAPSADEICEWVMKASMLLPSVRPSATTFEWMSEVMTKRRPLGSWRGVIEEVRR